MSSLFCTNKNQRAQFKLKSIYPLFCYFVLGAQPVFAAPLDDFVITINTTNPGSTPTQFTIPTTGGGYNYNVDCNDDGIDEFSAQTGSVLCDYSLPGAGIYTIRIKDNTGLGTGFPRIYFNNQGDWAKIISINQWGTGKWASMARAFYGCRNLNSSNGPVPSSPPDLSNVSDMSWMFAEAATLDIPINNWVTTNVTNMSHMFDTATGFNGAIGDWDTSNVTTMASMFKGAIAFNQVLGLWDTGNVEDMSEMFYEASAFNQFIGGWNTQKVSNMSHMFFRATVFDQNIGAWDTGAAVFMDNIFTSAPAFNKNIGNWDTSSATTMAGMLWNAHAFNQPIGNWDTSKVTDMSFMLTGVAGFNQPIGNWDTSKVTDMRFMFWGVIAFNQPIGHWDTSKVMDMSSMFSGATSFNQPIGDWNVTAVTAMDNMFNGVTLSTTNYDVLLIGWDAQVLKSGVTFSGGNSSYCLGDGAWNNMDTNDGWTISDGGINCPATCNVNLASGTQSGSITVEACDKLFADATLHGDSTSTVELFAGTGITFYPGFTMDQGGILEAKVCGQSLCKASNEPVDADCHPCVTAICGIDSFCCTDKFDSQCVAEVTSFCSLVCD